MEQKFIPDLTDIETWVFDLDNTLYPPSCNLFAQVDRRMTAYVRTLLNIPHEAARKIQKDFYRDYGTTLRGLMDCHQIDPDDFLTRVHDIDYSCLAPNPALIEALLRLDGRKIVFTNGSLRHAEQALDRLGLAHIFESIFDIKDADYIPKPERAPYEKLLRDFEIEPRRAVMFEDLPRNLEVPKQLGMGTVLVAPTNQTLRLADYIDFATDNLSHFLGAIEN